MGNKIKVLLAMIIILTSTIAYATTFSDIENHWAKDAVIEMSDKGIINGFEDGTFKPNEVITKEQFAKILVLSLDIKTTGQKIKFEDVENNRWSKTYIDSAMEYLTCEKVNGQYYFRPTKSILREDVAVAVVKAKGLENSKANYDVLEKFSDEKEISAGLRSYVAIAVENGIMQGKGGTFDPKGSLTRAEISQLLYNVTKDATNDKELKDSSKIKYGDVDNNGVIDTKDAIALLKYINGLDVKINKEKADIADDGKINMCDIEILYFYLADWDIKLPHKDKFTIKYKKLNDEKHNLQLSCECGLLSKEVDEKHIFIDGECFCGFKEKVEELLPEQNPDIAAEPIEVQKPNAQPEQNTIVYGDVNSDGVVDLIDYTLLSRYVDGEKNLEINKITSDVAIDEQTHIFNTTNGSQINMFDVAVLGAYFADYDITLPHKDTFKVTYDRKDEKQHYIHITCECGNTGRAQELENHIFNTKGVCVCGKNRVLYGDVDGNGVLNGADIVRLTKYLNGTKVEIDEKTSDVTQDGKIDIFDIAVLNSYHAERDVTLPHKDTFSMTYKNIDDAQHTIEVKCECGKVLSQIVEKHTYEDGKCRCGVIEPIEIICGDIDGNGKVDIKDKELLQKYVARENVKINESAADVTEDGKIDIYDVETLNTYLSKKNIKLPHNEAFTTTYNKLNSKQHNMKIKCKCGKISKTIKEDHIFKNGICECGEIEPEKVIYGDIDSNGKLELNDIELLQKYIDGEKIKINKDVADVAKDGKINKYDIEMISLCLAGKDVELPHKDTFSTKNVKLDNKQHTIEIKCKCGLLIKTENQNHEFKNRKCIVCKTTQVIYGDVDSNNKVNKNDLETLEKYLEGQKVTINKNKSDVTEDGIVDYYDYEVLNAYLSGGNITLPHEDKFITVYNELDTMQHSVQIKCECGIINRTVNKAHLFSNKKCVCGAEIDIAKNGKVYSVYPFTKERVWQVIKPNVYSDADYNNMEEELKAVIEEAGKGTRAAVLETARYLLELEYLVPYNGRGSDKMHMYGIGLNRKWGHYDSKEDKKYGLDCGGYMRWVFENAGVEMPWTGGHGNGKLKDYADRLDEVEPGDILQWRGRTERQPGNVNPDDQTHIGLVFGKDSRYIYIAESATSGIRITKLDIEKIDKLNSRLGSTPVIFLKKLADDVPDGNLKEHVWTPESYGDRNS